MILYLSPIAFLIPLILIILFIFAVATFSALSFLSFAMDIVALAIGSFWLSSKFITPLFAEGKMIIFWSIIITALMIFIYVKALKILTIKHPRISGILNTIIAFISAYFTISFIIVLFRNDGGQYTIPFFKYEIANTILHYILIGLLAIAFGKSRVKIILGDTYNDYNEEEEIYKKYKKKLDVIRRYVPSETIHRDENYKKKIKELTDGTYDEIEYEIVDEDED